MPIVYHRANTGKGGDPPIAQEAVKTVHYAEYAVAQISQVADQMLDAAGVSNKCRGCSI
jgi:hypothetical protein